MVFIRSELDRNYSELNLALNFPTLHSMTSVNNKANSANADTGKLYPSVQMARLAADGDQQARRAVTEIAHPIITYQTGRFCKRFCYQNRYIYRCTLESPWGTSKPNTALCEWGNASYAWMLDDLSNTNRLCQFEGRNGARINDYFFHIANSLPFYERWKDWRFGRKVHVPTYIQEMAPEGAKVFLALRNGDNIPMIAQKLMLSEEITDEIVQKIIIELTQRNRLHLLDPPKTVSLTDMNHGSGEETDQGPIQADIPSCDESPEQQATRVKLHEAWQRLTSVEQFILEAMLIEEQDAKDVLDALKKLNISLKPQVAPKDTDHQQLYYFRRKTIAKLAKMMD